MRTRMKRWLLALLVVLGVVGQALPAQAHAGLRRSTPADLAVLETAPTEVRLLFDEELGGALDKITVYGPGGTQVDDRQTHASATDVHELVVGLRPGLPTGGYRVVWHVVSVDGHVVEGTYTFSIGVLSWPPDVPGVHVQSGPGPLAKILYIVGQLGLMTAVGLTLFYNTVLAPVLPDAARARVLARWKGWTAATLGLGWLLSDVVAMPLKVAQATGTDILHLGWADLGNFLAAHGAGWYLVSQVMTALVGWLLIRKGEKPALRWVLVALGLLALANYPEQGHAAGLLKNSTLAIWADTLHLAAVSLWWGGVLGFVVLLAGTSVQPQVLGQAVKRFSPQAVGAVVVVVLTGLYGAVRHIPLLVGLTDTRYGWTLLAKVMLLLPLLLLGAANQLKAGPRLLAAAEGSPARFKRQVGIEVGLLAIVIALGGLLANSAPAEAELLAQVHPGPLQVVQQQGNLTVQAELAKNQVGMTKMVISVWQGGQPLPEGDVSATLDEVDMDMGHQEWKPLPRVSPGRYEIEPVVLGMTGLWELRLDVQVPGQAVQNFRIKFLTPEGEG